jgi:polyisoprenyl-phosphate glycosyltransferase
MIGIMGEYIAKVLWEIKGRPVYFVAEHSLKQADETRIGETARTAAE